MDPITKKQLIGSGLGLVTGGINALYATATQQRQLELQKEWWYEQQKYLEEHNSPAYRSMLLRRAGLNPYQDLGSQPLGNVSSDLPSRPMELFDSNAISSLMQTLSQLEVNESHAKQLDAQAGLFGAQTKTEGQRYQQLVQEWFYNEILYEIGLIDAEERGIKRDEIKRAYENGDYTPTSDAARAADDKHDESVATQELTKEQTETEQAKQSNLASEGLILQDKIAFNFATLLQRIGNFNLDNAIKACELEMSRYAVNFEFFKSRFYDVVSTANASILVQQLKSLELSNDVQSVTANLTEVYNLANQVFGFDVRILPPELQARLLGDFQEWHNTKSQSSLEKMFSTYQMIDEYIKRNTHIVTSTSTSKGLHIGKFGTNSSTSVTH